MPDNKIPVRRSFILSYLAVFVFITVFSLGIWLFFKDGRFVIFEIYSCFGAICSVIGIVGVLWGIWTLCFPKNWGTITVDERGIALKWAFSKAQIHPWARVRNAQIGSIDEMIEQGQSLPKVVSSILSVVLRIFKKFLPLVVGMSVDLEGHDTLSSRLSRVLYGKEVIFADIFDISGKKLVEQINLYAKGKKL